jgi:hypothetical protein
VSLGTGSEDGSDGSSGGEGDGEEGRRPEVGANGEPLWSVSPRPSEDGAAGSSRSGVAELVGAG